MRCTASGLLLLAGGCVSFPADVVPHALEPNRAYEAVHELRVRRLTKTPDGQPVRRDTIRTETYVDALLSRERAQRIYRVYEITEETAIGEARSTTILDPRILGVRITLLRDSERFWRPAPETPDDVRTLVRRTRIGPPRFWAGTSTTWRTYEHEPMLGFLGLGRYRKGTMRARFDRWSRHEGTRNAVIALEIDEEYEHARAVAKGWMIFDLEWRMIGKVALNGKIAPKRGAPETFQATRTWAPTEKQP